MAQNLISGIDIGSSKIATIVSICDKDAKQPRIIGFNTLFSKGVKKGLIVDIEDVAASIEESVEKAERMAGHKIHETFVSVGGPHISSLNSQGVVAISNPHGEIVDEDVTRVIEAARAISLSTTREIIEVAPREYIVDGQPGIKNPIGMSGVRLEVNTHIITASTTNLKNINRVLVDLGLGNSGFVFSGLASAESTLTETERELGVVLVDMGGGKTDICLYIDGALSYSASIPIGARHITNDIAVGLRVSLASAEKIKLHLSSIFQQNRTRSTLNQQKLVKKTAPMLTFKDLNLEENIDDISLKNLTEGIMYPRFEEIFKLIAQEIEKSGFGESVPSGLAVTGGGALTGGILEIGKKIIGLPLRLGTPEGVTGLIDEVVDPQFATTVGLILYGYKNMLESETSAKNFNRILKDFSVSNSIGKFKEFVKQFIP